MHNRHYIIVQAENEDDARYQVEDELDNYGNEDNWYEIIRVAKLSNDMSDEDRKYVQDELDYLNKEVSPDRVQALIDEIDSEQAKLSDGNRFHYFTLSELYKQLYEISAHTKHPAYTIEKLMKCEFDTFKCNCYDDYGLSDLIYDYEEELPIFFVEIDMHS